MLSHSLSSTKKYIQRHILTENSLPNFISHTSTLDKVKSLLSPPEVIAFKCFFNLPAVGSVNEDSPFVLGDTDGSTARLILLGIKSKKIDLTSKGVKLLVSLIREETTLLESLNEDGFGKSQEEEFSLYQTFQQDKIIQNILADLAQHLIYKGSNKRCISIGDGAHDRFSCNNDVDRAIREKMHEHGVIFITGNHDVFFDKKRSAQYGNFAEDTATCDEWMAHQRNVFSNVFYHEEDKTCYVHHGIRLYPKDKNFLETAFGLYELPQDSVIGLNDLFKWMNNQKLPLPDEKCPQSERKANFNYYRYLNKFRPTEAEIGEVADLLGIRIVHGHNGVVEESQHNVVVLNASSEDFPYAVVAARVGGWL